MGDESVLKNLLGKAHRRRVGAGKVAPEPSARRGSAEPLEPAEPPEAAPPTEPAPPAEGAQPEESAHRAEPAQPVEPAHRAEPGELREAWRRALEAELKLGQAESRLTRAEERAAGLERELRQTQRVLVEARAVAQADRETQRLAFEDPLTGLANLNLMRRYLDFSVQQVRRYGRKIALMLVDLDHFKLFNDTMGFKAGDELLLRVAERLQRCVRDSDAVGRKGEDKFLVLLSEVSPVEEDPRRGVHPLDLETAELVARRILDDLARSFSIQGQSVGISGSLGISFCPGDADSAEELLEHTQAALDRAKESGRANYKLFTLDLRRHIEERQQLLIQMRQGIDLEEFLVEYQPIVELRRGAARLAGVEALLRWEHPLEGRLRPDRFLPQAEDSGLVVELGHLATRLVCKQMQAWRAADIELFATINLSSRQVLQSDLVGRLLDALRDHSLPATSFYVEVTEGLNGRTADLLDHLLRKLEARGIGVAIDDFGAGVFSLNRLSQGGPRLLKLAPWIVNRAPTDVRVANLCKACIDLAAGLDLTVLGKGVENVAQARFLAQHGCRYAQGFYFSEPVAASEITALSAARRGWKV